MTTAARNALKKKLWSIQDGLCPLCGETIGRFADTSIEHVIPLALGGFQLGNKLASHRWCNEQKAHNRPTGCEIIMLAFVNADLIPANTLKLIEIQFAAVLRDIWKSNMIRK